MHIYIYVYIYIYIYILPRAGIGDRINGAAVPDKTTKKIPVEAE